MLLPIGTKGALLRCESQGLPTLVEKISGPTGQPCGDGGGGGDLATAAVCLI